MKKIPVSILGLVVAIGSVSCTVNKTNVVKTTETPVMQPPPTLAKEDIKEHNHIGIDLNLMDKSVRPQDDFYNYVNGGWMKTAVIPADKASWGSFNELREKTDDASLKILNKILTDTFPAGSEGEKIQNLYATYMDMESRNSQGINPIKPTLAKIDAINSIKDLEKYLIEATPIGENPLYDWNTSSDLKDSKMNAVYLSGPRLGLGRDYYQKKNDANDKAIQEYTKYAAELLKIIGYQNADAAAANVVKLEKDLAQYLLTLEDGRDANKYYNPKKINELKSLVKVVDLPTYLTKAGVSTDKVIVSELKYYQNIGKFINEKNLSILKDYLKLRLISSNAGNLDARLDALDFEFYKKYLQGQKEQRPMNKRALSLINGVLGEAFGKLYVDQNFPAAAKKEMETLISYLKKSYEKHIQEVDWMTSETRQKALKKLSKFSVKVAYPDKWEDYSALSLSGPKSGGSLYENLKNVTKWQYNKALNEELNKPVDKTKWGMSPQTVNAYYNSSNNEIVFPAGILQSPFFDFKADPAVNFGGIGAVIGHEISHGFDDGGSRFDGEGNLSNWWTEQDRKNFDAKVKQLAEQYNKYEPVKGIFVNGTFTSGENIADLGGVAIAYDALQMYLKDHGNVPEIDGYNQDQRFFMSWATVWRTKSTEKYLVNQVKTDPHSPGYFRAFGPLVNVDAFYKAFEIKSSDKHYKEQDKRIKIW